MTVSLIRRASAVILRYIVLPQPTTLTLLTILRSNVWRNASRAVIFDANVFLRRQRLFDIETFARKRVELKSFVKQVRPFAEETAYNCKK